MTGFTENLNGMTTLKSSILSVAQYANVSKLATLLAVVELETFLTCHDENGRTVLHWVCDAGIPEDGWDCYDKIIKWLLMKVKGDRKGRKEIYNYLNKQDKSGETALHIAIKNSCTEIADDLILKGADVTMKSQEDKSQMDLLGIYNAKAIGNDMNKNVSYIRKSRYCSTCKNKEQIFSKAATKIGENEIEEDMLKEYTFCLHLGTFLPYASHNQNQDEEDPDLSSRFNTYSKTYSGNDQDCEMDLLGLRGSKAEGSIIEIDSPTKKIRRPRRKLNRMTNVHPIEIPVKATGEQLEEIDVHSRETDELQRNEHEKDDDTKYERNEMEMVYEYNKSEKKLRDVVLLHPLLTAFLHLKWRLLQRYILFAMLYYLLWVVLYAAMTVGIYYCHYIPKNRTVNVTDLPTNQTGSAINKGYTGGNYGPIAEEILKALRLLITVFPLCFEIVQMFSLRGFYFIDTKNWAQLILIFLAFFEYADGYPRLLNSAAILCCIYLLLSQLDEFPNIIKDSYKIPWFMKKMLTWVTIRYFEIFRNLMAKISWLLIPFGLVMLGFLITFSILFKQVKIFDMSFTSYARLLALSVGHIGYDHVFIEEYKNSTKAYQQTIANGVYAIFVIIVMFVWSNFLIGITLQDFQKERVNAEKNSIAYRIEMMYVMEMLLHSIPTLVPCIDKKRFLKKISVLYNYGKDLECHIHVNKSVFPRDLVQELRGVIKEEQEKIKALKSADDI